MFAYKIKRPVRYPFVDLSSAERRRFFCEEELRLNRRFAPELYVDTCDITEAGGKVRMGGHGRVIERCVKMRQFDGANELDRLLAFDCIEFEPAFRWIDVAEEVALLVADLRARGRRHEAHAFLAGYLAESGDFGLLEVLDLYVAHRA